MKIESRQQLLLVLAIAAAVLFAGDRLLYEPLSKWWKARSDRIVALRRQMDHGRLLIQREQSLRSRWEQMRTNTLPDNTSLAEQQVLKAFDGWSRESGVTVIGITPQWKDDADDYRTLNCRVEATGDLEALSRFLYDIEEDPMALKLDSVELSARDNSGQQLTLGLQISGLYLVPPAE